MDYWRIHPFVLSGRRPVTIGNADHAIRLTPPKHTVSKQRCSEPP
jgi:hypothetical protein